LHLTATRRAKFIAAASAGLASLALAIPAIASAAATPASHHHPSHGKPQGFQVKVIVNGADLSHTFTPVGSTTPTSEPLTSPDDITTMGGNIFTTFQNGIGPQGQPSSDGNTQSTIVEFTPSGHVVRQWDLTGHCDGLTADPRRGFVIATVNEDLNSSIYTIDPNAPSADQVQHYAFNLSPLPHNGGTDAISIYHGRILISASAPGTIGAPAPQPTYPAVYSVTLDRSTLTAVVKPLFYDEADATVANIGSSFGSTVQLALTDPDSNEVVPASGPRFAGDFMLTSQGDMEQIFELRHRGPLGSHLAVLKIANSVDDTAWPTSRFGAIYGANTKGGTIDEVTGPFRPGQVFVAVTPCDANDAPATCPAPGFPPNYLGQLNPWTGAITAVPLTGPTFGPQGLLFFTGGRSFHHHRHF
jgi:hypothetical protein